MILRACQVLLLAVVINVTSVESAVAEWQPNPNAKAQVKSAEAIARFKEKLPASNTYFDDAYAFAVWPSVMRIGAGFGGAYGKGIVIQQDSALGLVSYWQFTSGIQAGAKAFSMMIFFKDETALKEFQSGNIEFMGQAGFDVATVGVHGTPAYNQGVAVMTLTNLGLMGEFTISGVKFRYRSLESESK